MLLSKKNNLINNDYYYYHHYNQQLEPKITEIINKLALYISER